MRKLNIILLVYNKCKQTYATQIKYLVHLDFVRKSDNDTHLPSSGQISAWPFDPNSWT